MRGYVDSPEGQIHYWSEGSGETVVLFHQSPTSSAEYADVVPILAGHYRVVAWDMPGRGNSYDPSAAYEIEDFARAMVVLLDGLAIERASLVGHHDGAIMAVEVAAMDPGRVDSIVLNGCAAWPERFEARRAAARERAAASPKPKGPVVGRQVLADTWDGYAAWSVPDARPDQVLPTVLLALASKNRPQFPEMVPLYLPKIQGRMRMIGDDVLLTAGRYDQYYVDELEATVELFPAWETSIEESYGNFPGAEDPEAFAAMVLAFLGRN